MTKKDLVDYILDTPQNINPAILNQMLDEVGGSSVQGDLEWFDVGFYNANDKVFCKCESKDGIVGGECELNPLTDVDSFYGVSLSNWRAVDGKILDEEYLTPIIAGTLPAKVYESVYNLLLSQDRVFGFTLYQCATPYVAPSHGSGSEGSGDDEIGGGAVK